MATNGSNSGWRILLSERAAGPVSCGLYACSPKAAGFDADFHFLTVAPVRGMKSPGTLALRPAYSA